MGIENRPYVGTWKLGGREIVQMTPDALVYINGDTSLPGCPKCNGRIDIQRFLTEVSVDAGTDPNGASCSFTLAVPLHSIDSLVRDAQFLLRPGLEVHVYMRGYFPVRGLYRSLAEPVVGADFAPPPEGLPGASVGEQSTGVSLFRTKHFSATSFLDSSEHLDDLTADQVAELSILAQNMESLHQYTEQLGKAGLLPDYAGDVRVGNSDGFATDGHVGESQHYQGKAADIKIQYNTTKGTTVEVDRSTVWASLMTLRSSGKMAPGGIGAYIVATPNPGAPAKSQKASDYTPTDEWSSRPHYDHRGTNVNWYHYFVGADQPRITKGTKQPEAFADLLKGMPPPDASVLAWSQQSTTFDRPSQASIALSVANNEPFTVATKTSMLENFGLAGMNLEDLLMYPYYHVFHGVVTQVGHAYTGGSHNISVQCASMLHFWQYHRISSNASIFGARPENSKLKTSLVGHNFTGMHPYQIIYTLHNDVVGAAAGVQWALSQKTNQVARDDLSGESLWSMIGKYWEKRFQERPIKLRLHGMSGELFSAAQAAFLSRSSSTELTKVIRDRFVDPASRKKQGFTPFDTAQSLGLFRKKKLQSLLQGGQNSANQVEVNLIEMQAFVSNIANWGQVNLFESAYESKLDIAQKVCEVTGFEFFQDVDGDFVFKPPMYNLDTSTSRIYRIEDIDIISINFDEMEPQATYATVKGSHFQDLQGTGLENEWGVQGQYIDFRLVAQFGWRPLDLETAYFNDPKSMFFAGINRIDLMNAQSTKASVTIPVRPEMRPGYPLYIPYVDSYYYCSSFAHSHSVGGQCTTSLQLVGKRSKFFAPGHVADGSEGIASIDLGNPNLPERPLHVIDQSGHPRLAGFPNVVLALDPYHLSPSFFVLGADLDQLYDANSQEYTNLTLRNLLRMGVEQRVLHEVGGYYVLFVDQAKDNADGSKEVVPVLFHFQGDNPSLSQGQENRTGDTTEIVKGWTAADLAREAGHLPKVDIVAAAKKYTESQKAAVQQREGLEKKVAGFDQDIAAKNAEMSHLLAEQRAGKAVDAARIETLSNEISQIDEKRRSQVAVAQDVSDSFYRSIAEEESQGVRYLVEMIRLTGRQLWAFPTANNKKAYEAHQYLDMLSDKKAVITNGKQPGSYRYFSASHPDPKHQGQDVLSFKVDHLTGEKKVDAKTPGLDAQWQGSTVLGFLPQPVAVFPNTPLPEAQLGELRPVCGIQVLTSNPQYPNGEVLPTSEIRELSFSVQQVTSARTATSTTAAWLSDAGLKTLEAPIAVLLQSNVQNPASDQTSEGIFTSAWGVVAAKLVKTNEIVQGAARGMAPGINVPPLAVPALPGSVKVGAVDVPLTDRLDQYSFAGSSGSKSFGPKWEKRSLDDVIKAEAVSLASAFVAGLNTSRMAWVNAMQSGVSVQVREALVGVFNETLFAALGAKLPTPKAHQRKVKSASHKTLVESPVFPVSDAHGYKVIGSYRYGRDVDIEPGGVWDALHAQDPFQYLDRLTVERLVDTYARRRTGDPGLEREVLSQLRRHLTDKQILDFGLASPGKDPNLLQLNLSNWFADGREGISKLPVNNAAFSLAELRDATPTRVCECRAAEADILIEAFGQAEFIRVGEEDVAWKAVAMQTNAASIPWQQTQQAYRGEQLDTDYTNIVESALSAKDSLAQALHGQSVAQKQADIAFEAARDRFLAAKKKIGG